MPSKNKISLRSIIENMVEKPQLVQQNRWYWTETAPQHTFHRLLALTPDELFAVQLNTRDSFHEDIAHAAVDFALSKFDTIKKDSSLSVFPGFSDNLHRFETVVAVSPSIHIMHKVRYPELHERLFMVFPAYFCELTGTEKGKEAEYLTMRQIPTYDLERSPCPLIRMQFSNIRRVIRSTGDTRKIATLDQVLLEVSRLDSEGSFVEIENFKGEVCTFVWKNGQLVRQYENKEQAESLDIGSDWIRHFCLIGGSE